MSSSLSGLTRSFASWRGPLSALVLIALGFLPIVNWVPNGRSAGWYGLVASEWLSGTLIVLGLALVLAITTKGWSPNGRLSDALVGLAERRPLVVGSCISLVAFVTYASVARVVFSGVPLHLDELAQVIQARIFAEGRLYLDAPPYPEFRSALHILDGEGKWFTQFPPGGPLLLVPGVWAGVSWVVGPLLGAASVAVYWVIVRRAEGRTGVALAATVLFAFAPFVAFMSGSHMNHVGALLWALVATYAAARLHESTQPSLGSACLLGAALGSLGTIRPVDAAAFALPAGIWLLTRTVRQPARWPALVVAGLGLAVPLGALAWYNWRTTGSPSLFAYEALWGPGHGLGFHAAPWGEAHTPLRGLELLSLYFLRLQTYLLESPVPSLSFAIIGFMLWRRWDNVSRYWWYSAIVLLLLYFAYWHDGFYLGPRFLYLLTPLLALWSVRGPVALAEWVGAPGSLGSRATWWAVAVSAGMALAINIPTRIDHYRQGLRNMRIDPTEPARTAGLTNALILVRESWGAQLVPRLWALGVSRPLTEALYRGVDTCELDEAIGALERDGVRGVGAATRLTPLLRESARLIPSPWSPDNSERTLPGRAYSTTCQRRVAEDGSGFTLFAPVLARPWDGNVYARDLHARDTLLLQEHRGRPVYLLRPTGPEAGAPLALELLNIDSLSRAWQN